MQQAEWNVRIAPTIFVTMALSLLIVPLRWLLSAILAACIHELFHILALRLLKRRIRFVEIGFGGVILHTEPMPPHEELICTLAGPLGGLSLLFAARWIPMTALCAAFQSLYNLLPIYPSDGGRALRCGAMILLHTDIAERLCNVIETVFLSGTALLGIYGSFRLHLGIMPCAIAFILIWKKLRRKIPLQTGRAQGTIYPL